MTTDEILNRLAEIYNSSHAMPAYIVCGVARDARNEIMTLRHSIHSLGLKNIELEKKICRLQELTTEEAVKEYARSRGWDCFKGADNGSR